MRSISSIASPSVLRTSRLARTTSWTCVPTHDRCAIRRRKPYIGISSAFRSESMKNAWEQSATSPPCASCVCSSQDSSTLSSCVSAHSTSFAANGEYTSRTSTIQVQRQDDWLFRLSTSKRTLTSSLSTTFCLRASSADRTRRSLSLWRTTSRRLP